MYDEADAHTSASESLSLQQQQQQQPAMTMLFSVQDLQAHVMADEVNLCCILVTSTLCAHSGVHTLRYPKVRPDNLVGMPGAAAAAVVRDDNYDDGYAHADDDDDMHGNDDDDDDEGGGGGAARADVVVRPHKSRDGGYLRGAAASTFLADVVRHVVRTPPRHAAQRRHVRFFHVCACTEAQANVRPRIARDAAFALAGRTPNNAELVALRAAAYADLTALLQTLAVRSTPCMLFFVRGQQLRYSSLDTVATATATKSNNNSNNKDSNEADEDDVVMATGCNDVKWKKVLYNAVVLRNALLREYDAAVRAAALQARRDARQRARRERKLARQERRRRHNDGEDDDEYDDEDDDA